MRLQFLELKKKIFALNGNIFLGGDKEHTGVYNLGKDN